jgi:hypothetical protein
LTKLQQLREWRGKPDESPISLQIQSFQKSIKRTYRNCCTCVAAWEEHVAPVITAEVCLLSLRKRVLTVLVHSSSAHFELDRHLRESGLAGLKSTGLVDRVRVKLAEPSRQDARQEMPAHVFALLEDWEVPGRAIPDNP